MPAFRNKKPKLFGTVTADLVRNMTFPSPIQAFTCTGGQTSFQTIGSTTITIGFLPNELFIHGQASFRLSGGNKMQVRIIRDGDEGDVITSLLTAQTTSGTWILFFTLFNEPVGVHTYQWQIKNTNNPGETSCVQNVTTFNLLSQTDDSHRTKNTRIING